MQQKKIPKLRDVYVTYIQMLEVYITRSYLCVVTLWVALLLYLFSSVISKFPLVYIWYIHNMTIQINYF
jgi:hypothetical protein